MTNTPVAVLVRVRELLKDSNRWTKAAVARRQDGAAVDADDPDACSWCLEGAVRKFGGPAEDAALKTLAAAIRPGFDGGRGSAIGIINDFNDSGAQSHGEILHVIKKAVDKATV